MTARVAACVALACLLAGACSSQSSRPEGGAPGFALANFTGATFRAVYLSPSQSAGWEENLLAGGELADGATVLIGFSPEEGAASWDLRVEGAGGYFAEWRGLHLRDVSRVTLLIDMVGGQVVVAEIE